MCKDYHALHDMQHHMHCFSSTILTICKPAVAVSAVMTLPQQGKPHTQLVTLSYLHLHDSPDMSTPACLNMLSVPQVHFLSMQGGRVGIAEISQSLSCWAIAMKVTAC